MTRACWICSQPHVENGRIVPARLNPDQACEHREALQGFWSEAERRSMGRKPPQSAPWCQRRIATRHLPGHERVERVRARRAQYLRDAGRTEAA